MASRRPAHPADGPQVLQEKAIAIENDIRGLLRNFGLKVGIIGKVRFEDRIRELVAGLPELAEIMACLLEARQSLRERFATLHRKVLVTVRDDDVCRRLMTIPGVGPVVSLAFSAMIHIPARFKHSKAVGPALGLTPVLNQSGESKRIGRVSLCGDAMMRALLYEAAQVLLTRVQKWSWLKAWAMTVARRRGLQKAIVALARRLAVIMHRLWSDGTEFRWTEGGCRGDRLIGPVEQPVTRTEGRRVSASRWRDVPRGTMDEVSSLGHLCRSRFARSERATDWTASFF